ncbi:MAG TPA: zf-HC2 domain-containing protein, partial [Thermoanaerobaculia bacterium]
MRCRSVLTRVDALRTGELAAEEQQEVSAHLETCKSCDASVDDVRGIAGVVKRVLAVVPPRSCRDAVVSQTCDSFDRAGATWVAWSDRGLRMLR